MTILIVDDIVFVRRLLVDFIKSHVPVKNLSIKEASNGREALEKIKTSPPDLIVTDIEMPIMDGLEFIKTVRNTGSKVSIFATSVEREKLEQAKKNGANMTYEKITSNWLDRLVRDISSILGS